MCDCERSSRWVVALVAMLAPPASHAAMTGPALWLSLALAGGFGVLIVVFAWGWASHRRLRRFDVALRTRVAGLCAAPLPEEVGADVTAVVGALLERAAARQADAEHARARAEAELRETQERYGLAVRGATDGLWEWNFSTRTAYFSPRAKAMLGFAEDEIGHGVAEWRARIHPDDLRHALAELRAFLAGQRPRYVIEHRMRHKDGGWRWVQARATVVRHASGKPERLIGLYSDITETRRVQQLLLDMVDGLSGLQGDACLQAMVRCFAQALGLREAFVCECCDYPTTRVRMLARWKAGQPAPCVEFDLAGTACEDVIGYGKELFVAAGASARWPLEGLFERDSYLGVPCFDSEGRVIGHVACADLRPMPEAPPHRAVLTLFALRAGLELERRLLERERLLVGQADTPPYPLALH